MRVLPLSPVYREANAYIADCGCGKCVVIDPGYDAERIRKFCEAQGLTVIKVLLTHVHFDHILALNDLCHLTGASVVVHSGDKPALYEPYLNLSSMACPEPFSLASDIYVEEAEEGEKLEVGDSVITVLHTPGHTPGSVCYLCEDVLFTGDTLFRGNIGRTDFPGGSGFEMKKSLERLKNLPGDYTLYSGHGAETTLSEERVSNFYLYAGGVDY